MPQVLGAHRATLPNVDISPELFAIVGAAIALAALIIRSTSRTDRRIDRFEDAMEAHRAAADAARQADRAAADAARQADRAAADAARQAEQAAADADRRTFQAAMDDFRKEMHRLAERQTRIEGAAAD